MVPGKGRVVVNNTDAGDFFGRKVLEVLVRQPLEKTGTGDKYDVYAQVRGGGLSGQAGAVRHGIARALLQVDPEFRTVLKQRSEERRVGKEGRSRVWTE